MKYLTILASVLLWISCATKQPTLTLPSLITDNMVLQQNINAALWGWSEPGQKIEIKASWGKTAKATTDKNGKWTTVIETPSYGGPFTLEVEAGETEILIGNVKVGEVWLCSGQSNMEMPLRGWVGNPIDNSKSEIAQANYPNLHMFTVTKQTAALPAAECFGSWEVCSPETAGDFSASAFYFGLKLYAELGIPVGLIHSSWGGTPAESWTTLKYVSQVEGFEYFSENLKTSIESAEQYSEFLATLTAVDISELAKENPYQDLDLQDAKYLADDLDVTHWNEMPVPSLWETNELPSFDGMVWLIKDFEYSGSMDLGELTFYLGAVDDMDATYLNGVKLGSNEMDGVWGLERNYPVPADLIKKGSNRIAVKVTDNRGGGGIYGKSPMLLNDNKELLDLSGSWKYQPVAIIKSNKIFVFGENEFSFNEAPKMGMSFDEQTPTTLYNGMIEPLVPFTIKGAIWYQGESNVGRGKQYETLFPAMIKSWREKWAQGDFPFYFVQIAPYNYGEDSNVSVADLRDAQRKTLKLINTGMAVTMDIGDPQNIHPSNKRDVGERLAMWALANDYAKDIVCSGPIFKEAVFAGSEVVVAFDYADGLKLVSDESFFEIAGMDGVFYAAKAKVEDNKIVVSSSKVKVAKQVRYAWCDDCEPNLFNGAQLPASSFITQK